MRAQRDQGIDIDMVGLALSQVRMRVGRYLRQGRINRFDTGFSHDILDKTMMDKAWIN